MLVAEVFVGASADSLAEFQSIYSSIYSKDTGWKKNTLAHSTLQNNNFLGNPFHEFKLWLIPEVTLHSKVAFGKK